MFQTIIKTATIGTLLVSSMLFADAAPAKHIVDVAGKQRMLTQRMAKDYFYAGRGINKSNALKQLKESLIEFKTAQQTLNSEIKDDEIHNLIAFVDMSLQEFEALSNEAYSVENGTIMLDLSESMLEGSDYVVKALTESQQANVILDISGKTRMLSQRIAKYYIAYQAGVKDDNTIIQMKETVKEFDDILKQLLSYEKNTPEITAELKEVEKMWKIVYKFYLNIEKGGLPKIVYSTTDNITAKMNEIVGMYAATLQGK